MAFWTTLSSVSIMGIMIIIGFLLRIHNPLTVEVRGMLIQLIVNVGMPCIILSSIFNFKMDGEMVRLVIYTFIGAVILKIIGVGVSRWLCLIRGYSQREAHEMSIVSALGNTGFIGIPLCAILFGPKGALLAAVFDAGMDFVLWSLAVFLLQKESKFSFRSLKAMINIPMIAIVVGLALGIMQFEAPTF